MRLNNLPGISRLMRCFTIALVGMALPLALTSCGDDDHKDEPAPPAVAPDSPDIKPGDNVADPDDAVTMNVLCGGDEVSVGFDIKIDVAHNFRGDHVQFVNVGSVRGLGNIVSIPTVGWESNVAVEVGKGYVAKYQYYSHETPKFARIYVTKAITNEGGNVIGYTLKAQYPFRPAGTGFAGGDGTEASPYLVKTPAQFDNVRNLNQNLYGFCYVKLANDIDMSAFGEWAPIPSTFVGQFDGANHTIRGLRMRTEGNAETFSSSNGLRVRNLRLEGIDYSGSNAAGITCGNSASRITGCHVSGTLTATSGDVYGIAPVSCEGCSAKGTFTATNDVFGISYEAAQKCSTAGTFKGDNVYGISVMKAENCYSKATIIASYARGIAGSGGRCCYFDGIIPDGLYPISNNSSSDCYYNLSCCQYTAAGAAGIGVPEEQLRLQNTFRYWDFENIWQIDEGVSTPTLRPIL